MANKFNYLWLAIIGGNLMLIAMVFFGTPGQPEKRPDDGKTNGANTLAVIVTNSPAGLK